MLRMTDMLVATTTSAGKSVPRGPQGTRGWKLEEGSAPWETVVVRGGVLFSEQLLSVAGPLSGPTGKRGNMTGLARQRALVKSDSCYREGKGARPRTADQGGTWGEDVSGDRAGEETAPRMCVQKRERRPRYQKILAGGIIE